MVDRKTIESLGELLVDGIKEELLKKRPKGKSGIMSNSIASGNLYKNIRYGIIENDDEFIITLIAPEYLGNIENGRKPNNSPGPKGIPPLLNIKQWIIEKGIRKQPRWKMVWAFAMSIKKRGIKPIPIVSEVWKDLIVQYVNSLERSASFNMEKALAVEFEQILGGKAGVRTIKI